MRRSLSRPAAVLSVALAVATTAGAAPPALPGVYQYVVHQAWGSVDAVASAIAAAAPGAGFQAVARVPVGSPAGCGYKAEVVALFNPDYGRQVLAANRRTGPFAVVDRVNVFEDEKGVHVSVTNPRSVLRTVLMDDQSQSFSIVGAGADSSREGEKCPGIAHAGAYPIEVVVALDGGAVHVRLVDSMYRMKMYFEDAGKWAFMKNMGMPGSIADEISAQVRPAAAAR